MAEKTAKKNQLIKKPLGSFSIFVFNTNTNLFLLKQIL